MFEVLGKLADRLLGRQVGQQEINSSYPSDGTNTATQGNTAWTAWVDNLSAVQLGFTVYAICAPASSVTGP